MMVDNQFWRARADRPACITFINAGGHNLAVVGPTRALTPAEQSTAERGYVTFCKRVGMQ
jgi:hypothetical protein